MSAPSRTGVAVAQALYEALNAGDLEAFFDLLHPDVEMREEFLGPDVAIYRGYDGLREWLARSTEALSGIRFEPRRFMRVEDSIVIPVRLHARGSGSGAEVTADLVHLGMMRAGKVGLLAAFPDLQSAVAVAAEGIRVEPEPLDAPDSVALREALHAELCERYGAGAEPRDTPTGPDAAVFLVARDAGGEAVGCGALRPLGDGGVVELKRMYVRPEGRGRGLGWVILIALEAEAERLGFNCLRLETGDFQPEAMSLYRAAGYREIPCFGACVQGPQSRCFERRLVG